MSVKILVDSSFLVAQLDEGDVHHPAAKALHELFRREGARYIYLDCVVNEVVTVLARRALGRKVDPTSTIRQLRREIPVEVIDWTGPELPRLWEHLLDTMEEYKGILSFHDCLLVLVSKEGGIEWIASFDHAFDQVRGLKRIRAVTDFTKK